MIYYKLSYKNSILSVKREDELYKRKIKKKKCKIFFKNFFEKSKKKCKETLDEIEENLEIIKGNIKDNNKIINLLNKVSLYSFIFGLLSLILFYLLILFSYVR